MFDKIAQVFELNARFTALGLALVQHNHMIDRIFIPIAKESIESIRDPKSAADVERSNSARSLLETAETDLIRFDEMGEQNSGRHSYEECASQSGDANMDNWQMDVIVEIAKSFGSLWKKACEMDEVKTRDKAQTLATLWDDRKNVSPERYVDILENWYKLNR